MPLDAEHHWQATDVLDGETIRRILEAEFGPLIPVGRPHASQPATDFEFADGRGRIGLIQPVSQSFCGACDRLRLTAEGQVRNCLFSTAEWDARAILRGDGTDDELGRPRPRLRRSQSPRPRHRHRRIRPARTGDVPNRRLTCFNNRRRTQIYADVLREFQYPRLSAFIRG